MRWPATELGRERSGLVDVEETKVDGGWLVRTCKSVTVARFEHHGSVVTRTIVDLPEGAEGVAYPDNEGHAVDGYVWVDFDQGFKRWVRPDVLETQLTYYGSTRWVLLSHA